MNKQKIAKLVAMLVLTGCSAHAQLIISDNYNVTTATTGFALDNGANFGINPPTTRLTGSAAANLRYLQTATGKAATAYGIASDKLEVPLTASSGRFTLSADGTTAFDFASFLTSGSATPVNPAVYDIAISMNNGNSGTTRFSFGFGTEDANVDKLDFALQLFRTNNTASRYWIQKRIDTLSSGVADLNENIIRLGVNTYGTELDFLMRVTDAGAESGLNYNSRVQVSMDGGSTWFYDTASDTDLPNGWRFDDVGRFFTWDQAGANSGSGQVTYDNFSVTLITPAVPEPSALALGLLGGIAVMIRRRR